jgi:hypothetical protein
MKNLISVSSAPIAGLCDREYYDFLGTIEVMKKVVEAGVVDGFELQLEPEWDCENPPLTDTDWADWTTTPKFTAEKIVKLIKSQVAYSFCSRKQGCRKLSLFGERARSGEGKTCHL